MKHNKHSSLKILSALEQDLLTLLSIRPLYGLEFVYAIRDASEGQRTLQVGSLYPTLHRLEKDNMIEGHWSDSTSSGAKRKYYTITSLGRQIIENTATFRQNLIEWAQKDIVREDFSISLRNAKS
jgi:PadR family transcriptional regulator, regulatory protein PadR